MEPKYVTFEQAKWLKDKGFLDKNIFGEIRLSQSHYYDNKGIFHNIKEAFEEKDYELKDCCNAPEQWQVIEWLRVDHGIWVYSYSNGTSWTGSIQKINGSIIRIIPANSSPQEAYSAAFDYILNNNLI
jgi:hypothetical protein